MKVFYTGVEIYKIKNRWIQNILMIQRFSFLVSVAKNLLSASNQFLFSGNYKLRIKNSLIFLENVGYNNI